MKKYKGILFFDVDGTLVDSDHGRTMPDENTMKAIRQAQENGYACMIASGRNYSGLGDLKKLGMDGYVFCDGGGVAINGEETLTVPVAEESIRRLIHEVVDVWHGNILLSHMNGAFASEGEYEVMYEWAASMAKEEKVPVEKVLEWFNMKSLAEWNHEEILEIDVSFPSQADEDEWLKTKDEAIEFVSTTASYGRGEATSGEVTCAGVTKGSGIRRAAEMLGVDIADTYCFGDSMNDAAMMKEAGHAIAMGNAAEELKPYADLITDRVDEEGIVTAMKKLKIIEDC